MRVAVNEIHVPRYEVECEECGYISRQFADRESAYDCASEHRRSHEVPMQAMSS